MNNFIHELANLLKIEEAEKSSEEELKLKIYEKINKKLQLDSKLSDIFDENFNVTEITIRVVSLINLIIDKLYHEKDKNLIKFISFILEESSRLLPIENISYLEKHPKWNYLLIKAGSGKIKIKEFKVKKFPIENTIAGLAYKNAEYIYIPNTEEDSRFNKKLSNLPIKSLLSVPLKLGDQVIGVLNFSHALKNAFNELEIYMLISLANLFSSILNLFSLYHEKNDFNSKLEKEVAKKTSQIQRLNMQLYKKSITDSLTGLYNRRFFFLRLKEEFSRFHRYGGNLCLIIFDLDRLKYINDKYGHLEGDKCIKLLAKILKKSTRKEDIIGRIGGDELACIIVGATEEGAISFAERVRDDLKRNYRKDILTISAGVGCLSKTENLKYYKNHKEFFYKVDRALLKAKKTRDSVASIENNK